MPGRDVQTVQKILVHQLVRPEKGHVDDVVHLVPVDRFGFQYADRIVEPVNQQARAAYTLHPAFQLSIVHPKFQVDPIQQRIQILQRAIQLLCYAGREAFQRPENGSVVLQQEKRVMIHAFLFLLFSLADSVIIDRRISQNAALC